MPYSIPGPAASAPLPVHSLGSNPRHRRSVSNVSFINGGPGAFTPMTVPRRKTASTPTTPRFHLKEDDDDDDSSHSEEEPQEMNPPVAAPNAVPFPMSSPLSSPVPSQAKVPFPITTSCSPRPSFSRTTSTPILLSNGKPLKSSLKSSSSSPNIPFPSQSLVPSMMHPHKHHQHHLRAASAPSTPHLPSPPSSPASTPPQTPSTQPKNVHFPSQEEGGLTTVRLFKRSARPAALSRPDEETETETEGEGSSSWGYPRDSGYPFPRIDTASSSSSPLAKKTSYELDGTLTSRVPASSAVGNVHLESLAFSSCGMQLTGTLIVRNLAYEKTVAVRFTLDEWDTTSEVLAKYVTSLTALPASFLSLSPPATLGDVIAPGEMGGWDRFGFTVRLEDYAHSLAERTMWLVARYTTEGGGEGKEWWDNNCGGNYRVAFKMCVEKAQERKRQVALSAPPAFPLPGPISSSASLPPSWTAPSYPTPSPRSPPTAAKAQTTLTRLKKLNLRNYAAPGTVGATAAAAVVAHHAVSSHGSVSSPSSSPPASPCVPGRSPLSTSTSNAEEPTSRPEESASSTPATSPLHTPLENHTLPLPLVAGTQEDSDDCMLPASLSRFSKGMDIVGGFPASGAGPEMSMGASPPFSSFDGGAGKGLYWSWGASMPSPKTSPPLPAKTPSTKTSPPPTDIPSGDKVAKAALPALLLDNIREKSTNSPPRSPRKEKPAFSLDVSSSSSGSDGDVPARKPRVVVHSPRPTTPETPKRPVLSRTSSSSSTPRSPKPASPIINRPHTLRPRSQPTPSPSPSSSSDEVYQAFVRQWCFAGEGGEKGKEPGVVVGCFEVV